LAGDLPDCRDFLLFLGRMNSGLFRFLWIGLILLYAGCANITAPTGGRKDTIPPKLLEVDPPDSLLNTRLKRIEFYFDEYITVSDASKEVQLSPILSIAPTVLGLNKHVVVKIVDSLLEDSTTYRLTFGNAIKDVHEGNPFGKYTYTFSTGPYFDSLILKGSVINAATGMADTGGIIVELYSAKENDSAVVRHKPKYITKCDKQGLFIFKGLPKRVFRIYALKDPNNNLIYDGPGEMIAFNDSNVVPGDSSVLPVNLRMFAEIIDTTSKKTKDTSGAKTNNNIKKHNKQEATASKSYNVNVDTADASHRTFDVNHPLKIEFTLPPQLNKDKISLFYDNSGVWVPATFSFVQDTLKPLVLQLKTDWFEDKAYTLKLAKGFAKDTAGQDLLPSKYVFRTMDDDDYGKVTVYLPSRFYKEVNSDNERNPNDTATDYVLMVNSDKDTVYMKTITDTVVHLTRLKVGNYVFRVIVDKNKNGKWDTGDLLGKIQPEVVIPYSEPVLLRAGWDNKLDFEKPKPEPNIKSKTGTLK